MRGYAFRIGWTQTTEEPQALYRIKVYQRINMKRLRAVTLPFFSVLENETFLVWEPASIMKN